MILVNFNLFFFQGNFGKRRQKPAFSPSATFDSGRTAKVARRNDGFLWSDAYCLILLIFVVSLIFYFVLCILYSFECIFYMPGFVFSWFDEISELDSWIFWYSAYIYPYLSIPKLSIVAFWFRFSVVDSFLFLIFAIFVTDNLYGDNVTFCNHYIFAFGVWLRTK